MAKFNRGTLLVSVAAVALPLMLSAPAMADALTPIQGAYTGHFNNMEDFYDPSSGKNITITTAPAVGDQSYGIDLLGNITSSSGGSYGGPGSGDYLIGVFGGITVAAIYNSTGTAVSAFGPGDTAYATGGKFQLWEIPQADFASAAAFSAFMNSTAATGYNGGACGVGQTEAGAAAGTNLCFNGLTTAAGATDVLNFTLQPSYDVGGTDYTLAAILGTTFSGVASTWGDVTGGTDAGQFENATQPSGGVALNAIGTLTDISLTDDFCPEATGCGSRYLSHTNSGWTTASSDPFEGSTVPEPGSLAIFGTALLGVGAMMRRRKKQA